MLVLWSSLKRRRSPAVSLGCSIAIAAMLSGFGVSPLFAQCEVSGGWLQTVQPYGSSLWVYTPLSNGQYEVRESGFGNAVGRANVIGYMVRVDWRTTDGNNVTGVAEWQATPQCASGSGRQVINNQGAYDAVWQRLQAQQMDLQ